jgi:hypothetical protein
VPAPLYPRSANPRVQRAKVSACATCNGMFEDDEPHFRSIITMAGEQPCPGRLELWENVQRSWTPPRPDGTGQPDDARRRFFDAISNLVQVGTRFATRRLGRRRPGKCSSLP